MKDSDTAAYDIAVVGLACRFPGAPDADAFWDNLRNGIDSITAFTDEELLAAGVTPDQLRDPAYVKAGAVLDGEDLFDAGFFRVNPREAALMEPQLRIFLETAWTALENAGHPPESFPGLIGCFAGEGLNLYALNNLYPAMKGGAGADMYQASILNDKDFLTTYTAYKLNLRGPAVTIQTACSTSLVAVHMACQSLLIGECDLALAGGVTVPVPQRTGYRYQESMILSRDGHCRAFDAAATGMVGGSGAGLVVLRRLADALAHGDQVLAVIKGSAVNNDGASKVDFTAPSVDGQAAVIAEAQSVAGVDPDTITYVEAHGTGTALGDPIEIAALTQAFRRRTARCGTCAIGSVKTNVGHLDTAAGVASLIKTVLALQHQAIPPSLHFKTPNPRINFADTPFFVQTALTPWRAGDTPRRAGVSSFGIGGTNAHVVVEEAPERPQPMPLAGTRQPILLSARTASALARQAAMLAAHLRRNPGLALADVAFTLACGRTALEHRLGFMAQSIEEAIRILENPAHPTLLHAGSAAMAGTPEPAASLEARVADWVQGGQVNWQDEPAFQGRRRLALPTYPFERNRYWIAAPAPAEAAPAAPDDLARKPDPADWFYTPGWRRLAKPLAAKPQPASRWLLLGPAGSSLLKGLCQNLQAAGHDVVRPDFGEAAPTADGFARLLADLDAAGRTPTDLVHAFSLDRKGTDALTLGFHSVQALAAARARQAGAPPVRLHVLTTGANEVLGTESLTPENAALTGLTRVIPQEQPSVACRLLDLDPAQLSEPEFAARLARELMDPAAHATIAFRGCHAWVQTQEPLRLEAAAEAQALQAQGVYVITGAFGGIGSHLVRHLAATCKARLALVGRTPLPDRVAWDERATGTDRIARAIRLVRESETNGSEVLLFTADVSDPDAMRQVLARTAAAWGPITGIVHAAGAPDPAQLVADMTPDESAEQFAPKLAGVQALANALATTPAGFCLCFSSLSAILGGLTFGAYAAANSVMDAFALAQNREGGTRWISVNWEGWLLNETAAGAKAGAGSRMADLALRPDEGVTAFRRILGAIRQGLVAVSTADLDARLRTWLHPLPDRPDPAGPDTAEGQERPPLPTPFQAPGTDRERELAALWTELLGIRGIGVTDDFFALGGNSLTAIQLVSRLRDAFQADVSVQTIFTTPTIAGLAKALAVAPTRPAPDDAALASLLDRVEAMPEEDVKRLLTEPDAQGHPSA